MLKCCFDVTRKGPCACLVVACICLLASGCSDSDDPGSPYQPRPPITMDLLPRWSPVDPSLIAYTHAATTYDELLERGPISVWILNTQNLETQMIAPGAVHDWSPDGQALLVGNEQGLSLFDLKTGSTEHIGYLQCPCYEADMSPCGTLLAYVREDAGVWVVDLSSGASCCIHRGHGPDWFHDVSKLVCDSLVIVSADGERLGKVPYGSELGYPVGPRWSPDGSLIAFTGKGGIWTVAPDGEDLRNLCSRGADPSWSPAGDQIVYGDLSATENVMVLWIMNSDGSSARQVTFRDAYLDST